MKKILVLIVCALFFSFSSHADLLVPPKLFAQKSKASSGKKVFSWTNSDKYTCDAPVTLFFEDIKKAREVLSQCPDKKGFADSFVERNEPNIEIYGKRYDNPTAGFVYGHADEIIVFFPDEIKLCPKDKPMLDNYGVCHSCDDDAPIDVSWMVGTYYNIREFTGRIKYFCSTICPNRHIEKEKIRTEATNESNYFCVKKGYKKKESTKKRR